MCPLDGGALRALPDPLLGRTIGGRYVITESIGKGGMGQVYRARHEIVGRDVAIKFLSPDLAVDATNRRRFLREAKAANRIDHEHIIDITDYGETDDGLVYLVMEFLDGEPLSALIDRGPLPPWRATAIGTQIAGALARAHELDVVHRDIKPDNVYLLRRTDGGDFVKLLDFGLAKMKGEMRLTASGAVFGTPEYMAPEQARGAPLTGKADLYALGCMLFEMTAGQPPFTGTVPELVLKHIREPAPSLLSLAPSAPPELDALVARLLEKDPARRHRDAYHVFEELSAIGERIRRPSVPTTTVRDLDLTSTLRMDRGAELLVAEALSSAPSAWRERASRFWQLAARAHPDGPPPWLTDTLRALDGTVDTLGAKRQELDELSSTARQKEGEARNLRLRLGGAIDALGGDESRALRELEELATRLEAARDRAGAREAALREAWRSLPPPPGGQDVLEEQAVEALSQAGRLATQWGEALRALESLAEEETRRARERDDLRFQIGQMKGRLGTLGAEAEYELTALRERTAVLDQELQTLLDRLTSQAGEIVAHLLSFEALAEDVRAAARAKA